MSTRPPRMDTLLAMDLAQALGRKYGASAVKGAVASALDGGRTAWRKGAPAPLPEDVLRAASALLEASFAPPLTRVVNATGVVLHTNLGRAPLSKEALAYLSEVLTGYVDLEVDLGSRARGHRDARLERAFREHFQTDRALVVVNNNAAAVLLMLSTLSAGKETLVSRGELVEIGGGFRIPEVMSAAGTRLREVGTTNRTRLADYRKACGPGTGLLLKVHPSNYRVLGFTQEVGLEELVALGRELDIPVGYDWGTGLALPPDKVGLAGEVTLAETLASGVDALCFSADKLFGSCQGGLLLVKPSLTEVFRTNPLLRALRVDKVTYALLGSALDAYRRGRWEALPALAALAATEGQLSARASRLKRRVERAAPGRFQLELVRGDGRAGGGTAPLDPLPSPCLAVVPLRGRVEDLENHLRTCGEPPVLGVLLEGRLLLHVRTLLPGDADDVTRRLADFGGGVP